MCSRACLSSRHMAMWRGHHAAGEIRSSLYPSIFCADFEVFHTGYYSMSRPIVMHVSDEVHVARRSSAHIATVECVAAILNHVGRL